MQTITVTTACRIYDRDMTVTHVRWIEWYMRVADYRRRGLTELTAQLAAGPQPDVPEIVPCPWCAN